ncbi:MAG: STAS-like domain-containing protein [Beijerinckiaceae bacterium]
MPTIEISKDFSRTPGGRHIADGPFSGELFRDRYLAPALREARQSGQRVVVILDGTRGYLSSFLEEAFGGLVRECDFSQAELRRILEIRSIDPYYDTYKFTANRCIAEAREKAIAS